MDFNDYNGVIDATEHALNIVTRGKDSGGLGYRHHEICVDVTGGTKIFTIAVSMVTLNRMLKFSYTDNDGVVTYCTATLSIPNFMGG